MSALIFSVLILGAIVFSAFWTTKFLTEVYSRIKTKHNIASVNNMSVSKLESIGFSGDFVEYKE